ncbi:carbamoyltransferase HypF [Cystobacter ferrugineus]|uniref:Carbamoyltransferase n=1 Tax=Cystobacter ferrugineus TaxID=83449 RepID=A0A1L9AWG3_9BACT|nr:carbamoyltransferase HypF [Cystobacter ferrugineus]OJH34361.1 carbamoyltransferase HypF [Cystobacter ferrugineus]
MRETRRYRINGIVQGVGFRPCVHRLARQFGAGGWVLNDSDGVLLEVQGPGAALDAFMDELVTHPPPMARILRVLRVPASEPEVHYEGFEIKHSVDLQRTETIVPPDSNVCEDCLREMKNPEDRRHRYPFINCTNCGPRYSIIYDMPYDRPQSTMRAFRMCGPCEREYHDIEDRRYHAQPNACPDCGPRLEARDRDGQRIDTPDVVRFAIARLREGAIFAVKSLGGFHLVVDAANEAAVRELRRRKRRDAKPFAIMVADRESARRVAEVSHYDEQILESPQRPIVLLRKRPGVLSDAIAPRNPNLGIMLPSTPLHYLLLEDPGLQTLVMTSGNMSGHPICYDNESALTQLRGVVDYFVLHDRDIRTRVDDSLVRPTQAEGLGQPMLCFVRRSRGYAPYPIHLPEPVGSIVALGAELKTTVALSKKSEVFVGQHIGDLKNDSTFEAHTDCAKHMQQLLSIRPDVVACDMHPAFRSSRAAVERKELRVVRVQHHHAHMASCMAENGLTGKVIGAIFDGSGYGLDGTIWGGEFLYGDYREFTRVGHLRPLYLLGGDKAVREPIRVAISLLTETFGEEAHRLELPALADLEAFNREVFFKMAAKKINATPTTSMGRLFDGVSSLLRICHQCEYEAQAAIELEALLDRDFQMLPPLAYSLEAQEDRLVVDYRPLIRELVEELRGGATPDVKRLSRRFHSTVVDIIGQMCGRLAERHGTRTVVLSGGVFMNEYVLVNALRRLKELGLEPHCHRQLPTNDGGISLGQIMVAHAQSASAELPSSQETP